MSSVHAALLVATMAAVTMLTRFLPFLVFRKETPAYVSYLGRVLPTAIIGMLVVYCLRGVSFAAPPFGLPLQVWRRNSLASILTGTFVYMLLIHLM